MFREMRRKKQQLSDEQVQKIMAEGVTGVLAVLGDDGYLYTVPLNYVYADGEIYFHCAKTGHKIDAINRCPKVSFCVIEKDEVVAEKFTTYFRSVVAFGRASQVEDDGEKLRIIRRLNGKYAPGLDEAGEGPSNGNGTGCASSKFRWRT